MKRSSKISCQQLITLRQGLIEYYKANPEFNGGAAFLGMETEVVREHDAVHVVFGLGTTSREELLVEVITLLGCDVGRKNISDSIKRGFFVEVLKTFGPYRLIKRFILTIPDMIKVVVMCLKMKKKWPHSEYKLYLDVPLKEIRAEFNIHRVVLN